MKQVLLASLLLISIASCSQGGWIKPSNSYGNIQNRISIDSTILLPTGCGTPTSLKAYDLNKASYYFDSCNHKSWFYDPKLNTWDSIHLGSSTLLSLGTGLKIGITGTNDTRTIDGANGLFPDSTTTSNVVTFNLGATSIVNAANKPFTSNRYIQAGAASVYSFEMFRDISSFGPPYTSFPYTRTIFPRPTQIELAGVDGGNLSITIYDSTTVVGDSYPGIMFYAGYNKTLQGAMGMVHWTSTDKHFDITDMRGSITYAAIQSDGSSIIDFRRTTGNIHAGLIAGSRFGIGYGLNAMGQKLSVNGSMSTQDSVLHPNLVRLTDTTGFDIALINRTTGNMKKMYAGLIGGGSTYTFSSPLSESGGTVSIANAAADGSTKGAASFTAADFNASSGNISIDYANGQAASLTVPGFITTGSQSITGMKSFNGITMLFPFITDGIIGTANEDRNVAAVKTKNSHSGVDAAMSIQLTNNSNNLFQLYNSSSTFSYVNDGAVIDARGAGGLNFAAAAGDFKWFDNFTLATRLLTLERSSGRLAFGSATSSFPALVANSTNLSVMLGDGSAYTNIIAAGVTSGSTTFNNANTNATTVNAFGAATTITIGGTPTGAITHNYSNNVTSTGNTKTINIGTGGASGSTTNIILGSANGGNSVSIGTASPDASSALDIVSTVKGVLLPRMTKAQRDAISSPATGLMVYQTDNTPGLRVWNGTNWMRYTETAD